MQLAVLALALMLGDQFLFEGRYRDAAWYQLRAAGDHLNAELGRINPARFGNR
jgi:hypothetical protein